MHGPGIDEPLASIDAAGIVSYYLADHLGSVVQQTTAAGTVSLTRQYDPNGVPLQGATASGYAFTGREWDAETALYYYRARYFDPVLARFLSEDPAQFIDGPNLYSYGVNKPTVSRDPSGHSVWVGILGGAEVGAIGGPVGVVVGGVVGGLLGLYIGNKIWDRVKPHLSKMLDDDAANEREFDRSLKKPNTKAKDYRPRNPNDASSSEEVLDDITKTQNKHIKTGHPDKIRDTSKSKQRFNKNPKCEEI